MSSPEFSTEDKSRAQADGPGLTDTEVKRRATSGALTLMLRGLALRGTGLLGNAVLARLLVPRQFGVIAVGLTIVGIGDFLASGGLGAALIRKQGTVERIELQVILGFQLAVTAFVAALITVVGFSTGSAGPVAAIMVWSLVIDCGRAPNAILLERDMAYKLVVRAEVAETLAWNVWAVAAVALGFGVWGVASAQIVRAIVGNAILTLGGPTGLLAPRFVWSRLKPLLATGLAFQGFNLITLLREQGLNLAIAAIGGLTAVGLWSIVYRMTLIIGVLFESLWRVSFPAMSRMLETGADPKPVVTKALSLSGVLTGFLVIPLAGSSPSIIPILFGPHWGGAIDAMPATAMTLMLAGPIGAVAVGYLMSIGQARLVLWGTIIDTVLILGIGLTLLPSLKIPGLALGQLSAGLSSFLFLSWALARHADVIALRFVWIATSAAALGSALAWLISSTGGATLLGLVSSIAGGETLYVAVLLLAKRDLLTDVVTVLRRSIGRPAARLAPD